ncbi:MAG: N-formylglutamate amidohydrolase [Acetobacteraceae bacterium]|nr:N-formylglutamate amidohydrolase [Acetobacteraceae bacterium]MCX7684255.1 N-formylglutamate amidohydrolase [Acetobacteraceae bacterium]MDW8398529.1 N-formylglutamate amidohydrolase [Acetobacteraceae bacterium]
MDLPVPYAAPAEGENVPFRLFRPAEQRLPFVLASPHSGRDYPESFLRQTRLDALARARSEDAFVEEIFGDAPRLGAPLLAATFPRVFCDVNREPWELDPAMFEDPLPEFVNSRSPRVGAGLGTIARIASGGEAVYRGRLTFADAEARVRGYWQPYHAALSALIAETRARFGACLLLDCHSMPAHPQAGAAAPDIVLGDAHGTAAEPRVTRAAEQILCDLGYRVRRNDPYAGGYVTRHYGRPREGVQALQIEIARRLYMDEARVERTAGFAQVRADMARLVERLGAVWERFLLA